MPKIIKGKTVENGIRPLLKNAETRKLFKSKMPKMLFFQFSSLNNYLFLIS